MNLKADPNPELLEKLETHMHLQNELDEKNSQNSVWKHRAKLLLEGEKPIKYTCAVYLNSLLKIPL